MTGAGRYAPSPSGDLHLGNLRTALIAWLWARSTGRAFYLRVEDLDRGRSRSAQGQLDDLAALGLTWDGEVMWQSNRISAYDAALRKLDVYECYCTRADIQNAPRAPHAPEGAYPGTCRNLLASQREQRRAQIAPRMPSLRLRAGISELTVRDELKGAYTGVVDDLVLRRGDGTFAYNLAVVVDDAAMGVDQVVRGDDLLPSTPRQVYLQQLLGLPTPSYGHVPLVLGPTGKRLAKRDGAVTLADLAQQGVGVDQVRKWLFASIGMTTTQPLAEFSPHLLPREPIIVSKLAGIS